MPSGAGTQGGDGGGFGTNVRRHASEGVNPALHSPECPLNLEGVLTRDSGLSNFPPRKP